MSPSTLEKNKSLIYRYVEAWNQGDLPQRLDEFWSPDLIHHTRGSSHGFEEAKRILEAFASAFPDTHFQIEDIIAEGDKVATHMTWRATHSNSYMGSLPTGKKITCTLIGIARVADGKIVEHWGVTDELHLMQQIGLLPEEVLAAMA